MTQSEKKNHHGDTESTEEKTKKNPWNRINFDVSFGNAIIWERNSVFSVSPWLNRYWFSLE